MKRAVALLVRGLALASVVPVAAAASDRGATGSKTYLQTELDATGGRSGRGLGLVRVRDKTVTNDVMPGSDASRIELTALLVDRGLRGYLGRITRRIHES
jgi:hypothetical protein